MKPFAMQPVLQYREQLERIAQQQLAQAQEREISAMTHRDKLASTLAQCHATLSSLREDGVLVASLLLFEDYMASLRQLQDEAEVELAAARSEVTQQRQILLKKSQDKNILEKLKMHQNLQYRRHLDQLEQRQLDEVAVIRHQRNG